MKKRSHTIYFDEDRTNAEFIECKKNYRGYKESDEVCEWLSEIFEEDVLLIKCEKERVMTLKKDRLPMIQEEDRRGNFITDAAIHVINQ